MKACGRPGRSCSDYFGIGQTQIDVKHWAVGDMDDESAGFDVDRGLFYQRAGLEGER
jgi:hypothetical protein